MIKELTYPFDADEIIVKKRAIKRKLLEGKDNMVSKKVAILGGYTTNNVKNILELFLMANGILPEFYESEYARYYEDAVFGSEELDKFAPDLVYICTCNRNVPFYPEITDSAEEIDRLLDDTYSRFLNMWESIRKRYNCPVIQNNFEMPYYRLLGNSDASDLHGKVNFLTRLNMKFYEYARSGNGLYICDINYISADYGLSEWSDPFYWYMYKYGLNASAIPYLAMNVANIIKSIYGKNKKGLVLDLDNTLWGGVIGDDGQDGIEIGQESSDAQAYSEFQDYISEQKKIGVLLNVNSKNDVENAMLGLQHPDSKLSPDDFICIKSNWEPKDRNFKEIADELGLLPESLVFVDDNPAERQIVTDSLPGVSAPELGEIHERIRVLDRSGFFEVTSLSDDDLKRNDMYKKNVIRRKQSELFSDYHEYLLSLGMKAVIRPFEELYYPRIAQLTNKSNQFNLTTKRYTVEEIASAAADNMTITLYGRLEDRYGDNGIVSVVIGSVSGEVCDITLWLMSCRVLKRDMEYAMFDALVDKCREVGVKTIIGNYYPTSKNSMVAEHYKALGFSLCSEDEQGHTVWSFDIPFEYSRKNTVIDIGK